MKVSLRDVAKRAGVSPMTVSRVINNAPSVRQETRERVEEVIALMGYIPNRLAQGLISQRTGTIGLILPDVANPFFALVLRAAEITARREGYRLLVCNTEGDAGLERDYIHNLISHQVDGLIVAPVGDRSHNGLLPLIQRNYPLVLLDRVGRRHRMRSGAGRQRRRGAAARPASHRHRPSPDRHDPWAGRRFHHARAIFGILRGAENGEAAAASAISSRKQRSICPAAIAPCSRSCSSTSARARSLPSTT